MQSLKYTYFLKSLIFPATVLKMALNILAEFINTMTQFLIYTS